MGTRLTNPLMVAYDLRHVQNYPHALIFLPGTQKVAQSRQRRNIINFYVMISVRFFASCQ